MFLAIFVSKWNSKGCFLLLETISTEMLQLFFAIKTVLILAGSGMERTFLFLRNATHDGVIQNGRLMNSKYLQWNLARVSSILSQMNVQCCKIRILCAHSSHPSTLRAVIWSLEISYLWHDRSSSQAGVSHAMHCDATRLTEKWESWWIWTGYWK